jgi:hypothetical protein
MSIPWSYSKEVVFISVRYAMLDSSSVKLQRAAACGGNWSWQSLSGELIHILLYLSLRLETG